MGSILSSFGVPNSMIPEILVAAEKIMMSDAGALSAGVFLSGICSSYIVRTASLTTSSWHAPSYGHLSPEIPPFGDVAHHLIQVPVPGPLLPVV
jgi:hypothetical protein